MQTSIVPFALTVDDDALIRMGACHILEAAGFRCLDADTGAEAREVLGTKFEQIVERFTDVEMPGFVDGFASARHGAWPADVRDAGVSVQRSPFG